MNGAQAAHAILLMQGKYVLQLRDNDPKIPAPNQWCLFGGRLEKGESPLEAIKREVREELLIDPVHYEYFTSVDTHDPLTHEPVKLWVFVADVDAVWPQHRLCEGQAVGVFDFAKLRSLTFPLMILELIESFEASRNNLTH